MDKRISERREFSQSRLLEFENKIKEIPELKELKEFTIFAVGSYARLEASEYSDLDLFFICESSSSLEGKKDIESAVFTRIKEVAKEMGFPEFSNNGEFLKTLCYDEQCKHLGSPEDDYGNFFTARMLLFLESKCLYGNETYDKIIGLLVNNYFKDYNDHPETFGPTFLLNDIQRYWKTLLLNYENKRGVEPSESGRKKAKVKNFKLKFSRMVTCFSLIAVLGTLEVPVTPEKVIDIIKKTPNERLDWIVISNPELKQIIEEIHMEYSWFLSLTGLPTEQIQNKFDNNNTEELFDRANQFGDKVFELLLSIDKKGGNSVSNQFLRKLVI